MRCWIVGLQAIPLLQKSIKIQRARMRLRLQVPAAGGQEIRDYLKTCNATIESQDLSLEGDQVGRAFESQEAKHMSRTGGESSCFQPSCPSFR